MSTKKLNFWEFFGSEQSFDLKGGGASFLSAEPQVHRLIKEQLKRQSGQVSIIFGQEITHAWIEGKFQSLSFFGESESYLVLFAERIPKKIEDSILELFPISSGQLSLIFSKDCGLRKKLVKQNELVHYDFPAPPFWKFEEVLAFFVKKRGVQISSQAKHEFLLRVDQSIDEIVDKLNLLALNVDGNSCIELELVQELLTDGNLDIFELARLIGNKRYSQFFTLLDRKELSFDQLREAFSFLERHLLKVYDPSEIRKKNKANKYDKEIIDQSTKWEKNEILNLLSRLGEWQVLCKTKSPAIYNQLQRAMLKTNRA